MLVGLIVGIFRDPFLDTVLWGVGIGLVVGAAAGLLGWVSDVMRRRRYRGERGVMAREAVSSLLAPSSASP